MMGRMLVVALVVAQVPALAGAQDQAECVKANPASERTKTALISGATPSVSNGKSFKTNNSRATTVTEFTGGADSQTITVSCGDMNTTIEDNSNIVTANGSNFTCAALNQTIVLTFDASRTTWIEPGAATGGVNPASNASVFQANDRIAGVAASSIIDTGTQVKVGRDAHFAGPNPSFDVTFYGAYFGSYPPDTGSIREGSTKLTLASAQDYATGEGITVYEAGPASSIGPPGKNTAPTLSLNGYLPTSGKTYTYCSVSEDRHHALSKCTPTGSITGPAILGLNAFGVTAATRDSSGVTTYTLASPVTNLQAGTNVAITGFRGVFFKLEDFNGVKTIVSLPDSRHFTVSDGGAPARSESGQSAILSVNACIELQYATGTANVLTLRSWHYRNGTLIGSSAGADPYYRDCGVSSGVFPSYVPTSAPSSSQNGMLVTTVSAGGGTRTLTLVNSATVGVSNATVVHDNHLALLAAEQAAINVGGGTVYIPSQGLTINSTFDQQAELTGLAYTSPPTILLAGPLALNEPLLWASGIPLTGVGHGSQTQFEYLLGASIGGTADPLIMLQNVGGTNSIQASYFSNLHLILSHNNQIGFFADETAGGGVSGSNWNNVAVNSGGPHVRPYVLKGNFDWNWTGTNTFFSQTDTVWPANYSVEFTCSSPAVMNSTGCLVPGRIRFNGEPIFLGAGILIDNYPDRTTLQGAGAGNFWLKNALYESNLMPLLRVDCGPDSYCLANDFLLEDNETADNVVGVGTPLYDFTNTNTWFVTMRRGITADGSEPGYVNGSGTGRLIFENFPFIHPAPALNAYFLNNGAGETGVLYQNEAVQGSGNTMFGMQLLFPSGKYMVTAVAGGSLPVGTVTVSMAMVDFSGRYSTAINVGSVKLASGTQSINLTFPAPPSGAQGYVFYLNNGGGGPCNPPFVSGTSLSITSTAFFCGNGPSSQDLATSPSLDRNGVASTKFIVNGETVSAAPRGILNAAFPGNLTSTWTAETWTLDKSVVITRIQVQAKTAPSACSTNAIVRVTDGTNSINVSISAAANDSGAISQKYAAGASLTVAVQTAASGCSTNPADANLVVQYRMQ